MKILPKIILIICTILYSSCSNPKQEKLEFIQKHRPAFDQTMQQLQWAKSQVSQTASITQNQVDYECKKLKIKQRHHDWNTLILHNDDFNSLDKLQKRDVQIYIDTDFFVLVQNFQNPESSRKSVKLLEFLWKQFQRIEIVGIVRQVQFIKPELASNKIEFTQGYYGAEVLFFDIKNQKYLGAIKVTASNTQKVTYEKTAPLERIKRGLLINLSTQAKKNLEETLSQACKK